MSSLALRPFQIEALDTYRKTYGRGNAHLGIAATGAGKTVLFVYLAGQIVPKTRHRFVVLAHREALVRQAAEKARRFAPDLKISLERGTEKAREEDDFIVSSFQTLRGERLDCFLERIGLKPSLRCSEKNRRPIFLVVDEAHHALAPTYVETIKTLTSHPESRLLGVTATPFRSDDDDGANLRGLFPQLAFKIERGPLIDENWLASPRHYLIKTGSSIYGVKTKAGDYDEKQLAIALDLDDRNERIVALLKEAAEEGIKEIGQTVLRGVVFALSVDHARKIAEMVRALGWDAAAITAETPVAERQAWDERLAKGEKHTVLTSYGVLTEGWDVEAVNVGVFARPTKSRVLADQMTGRILRYLESKPSVLAFDLEDDDAEGRVSIASIFSLPPPWNGVGECLRADEVWFKDKLRTAAYSARSLLWKCATRAEVEAVLADPNRGPALIETTGFMWWDMGPGELRLQIGKQGTIVVTETDFGDHVIEWRAGLVVQELGRDGKAYDAIIRAQHWAEDHFPTEASSLRVSPGNDSRPASAGQLEYMRRLGIEAPVGTSIKDARIAISIKVVETLKLAEEGRCTFGKYAGALAADIPTHYLEWALGSWVGSSQIPDRNLFERELERRGSSGRSLKKETPNAVAP